MFLEKSDLSQTRPIGQGDRALCAAADALVTRGLYHETISDIADAADLYERALKDGKVAATAYERAGIENSLGSALCLLAQSAKSQAEAGEKLDAAERYLKLSLRGRTRRQHPREWATTQTNLALVYVQRYATLRSSCEMFAAVAALSEAAEEFKKLDAEANLAWVREIEDYATALRAA